MSDDQGGIAKFFSERSEVDLNTCPVITGSELGEMLAPITVQEFFSDYFLRRSVLIRGEGRQKLGFVNLERLRFLFELPPRPETSQFLLVAHFGRAPPDSTSLFKILPHQVGPLLKAGATICANHLHLIDPDLYRLTRALKLQVVSSGEVGVNCYISPTGSGFGKHFDSKAIMVVQVAGSKHWIYGKRPVVEFPQRAGQEENGQIQYGRDAYGRTEKLERAYPVGDEEFEECVLEPGDVLCLPPGTWHSACAKEFSIGLTVTFYPVNFTGVLFPLLETELRKEVPWRAGPPLIPGPAPDTPPESVRCYFRERLAELRKAIDSIDENDPRLWGAWYSGIASTTQCNQRADIHRSQSNGFIGINRAIPFCHYVVSSDGENRIVILHGPKRVTIHSTRFLSLIRALADGKIFQRCAVPTEMVDGCPPSAVDKLWDTLLEAGIAQYVERSSA